jgi:hypothetical protein
MFIALLALVPCESIAQKIGVQVTSDQPVAMAPSRQGTAVGPNGNEATGGLGVAEGTAGGGLVIVPIFDASIINDPNGATIMNTINRAIAVYKAAFCDAITVTIQFQEVTTGLGASSTFLNNVSYSSYLAALTTHATTANDAIALAHLPAGPNNPVNGNANMAVATANLRALGLPGGVVPVDSTISLNTSICNLDRSSIDPTKYDLMAVVMHEIDEALSIGSALDGLANGAAAPTGAVEPADLFRYDGAGNRSLNTTLSSQAYFSIDGAFQLARFNQSQGGDFGDWFSTGPHIPQVQDAFATAGATPNLGVELVRLDVVGYCLVSLPKITIPGDVSFADTCVGSTNFATLYVCNTGTADLQVGPVASSDSQFAVVTPSSGYPVTISPDFCFPFRVRFAPTSLGDQSTTFSILSNDPTSPTNAVRGFGKGVGPTIATAIPDSGNFGDVCLGSFKDLDLIINNRGGCDLLINNITSSSGQFIVPGVMSYPLVIHPGDSLAVPIRFQPTSPGLKSGMIFIASNDRQMPSKIVNVSGNAPTGDIRISGSTDFGDVCGGTLAEKTISICNVGLCGLRVTSVAVNCADFTIVNNPFPATVSHDFCVPVVVRFTPTSCGPRTCTLTIISDDPDSGINTVTLTANTPCPSIDVPPDLAFLPEVIQTVGTCNTLQPFPISNKGQCNLIITAITIGGVNAGDYALSGLPSFPIILQPGHIAGEGDLNVVFAPTVVDRDREATITVTYVIDPTLGTTAQVTRKLCGEGVRTGARVLVTSGGIPVAKVEKIHLQRLTGNRNRDRLDSVDVVQKVSLVTVTPALPCQPFQYHREYGTVSNPVQLPPGSYQVTATAIINGKHKTLVVGFDVQTCDFNPTVVVDF